MVKSWCYCVPECQPVTPAQGPSRHPKRERAHTWGTLPGLWCLDSCLRRNDRVVSHGPALTEMPSVYGSGTLRRKFVYGPGLNEPICLIEVADNNAVYYYHFDGLGSVVALSNLNRVLVERYTYDVFGRPTIRDANGTEIADSACGNPYRFTGRAYDAETALYYYRARYYDYATARFLQPDPTGYTGGLNLYAYVDNNPLNWTDAFGLCKGGGDDSSDVYADRDVDFDYDVHLAADAYHRPGPHPGKRPPPWWNNKDPGPGWTWDAGSGRYKKGGEYKHLHEGHGKRHWEVEDKAGNRIRVDPAETSMVGAIAGAAASAWKTTTDALNEALESGNTTRIIVVGGVVVGVVVLFGPMVLAK